jgi:acyl CoA:acetate/3-ketoacid CoA transferase beta subunit
MNTSDTADAPTAKEIMATVLARDLVDGEWVEVGANLPVPRAGVLLAHLTRGPNMTVMIAMTKANVQSEPVIEEFELITDYTLGICTRAHNPVHAQLLADLLTGDASAAVRKQGGFAF